MGLPCMSYQLHSALSEIVSLVLRTSNFQGATIRMIVLRHKHSIVESLLFTTKFSSACQFKTVLNYFQIFWMKAVKAKRKI